MLLKVSFILFILPEMLLMLISVLATVEAQVTIAELDASLPLVLVPEANHRSQRLARVFVVQTMIILAVEVVYAALKPVTVGILPITVQLTTVNLLLVPAMPTLLHQALVALAVQISAILCVVVTSVARRLDIVETVQTVCARTSAFEIN